METDLPPTDPSNFETMPAVQAATGGLESEDDETSVLDVLDFLIVLAQRKGTILKVTAATVILATILAFALPKRYTAQVSLLPPQQSSSMGAALASQLGNLGGMAALAGSSLGLKNPNDMYVSMLKSQTVEDAMIKRYGLMKEYHKRYLSDARKALEKRASIDGSNKDGLIRISVTDGDPQRAATLANGYVDQFRDLSEHLAITEASQRRLFFEQQLEQAKDKLADAEEALKETEQKTGLIQLDSQARALIESAASLRAQIAAKEVQIQGMRTYASGENAQLMQATEELDSLRTQLAKLGGSEDLSSGGLIVPKGKVPEAGLEYVRKLRDVKYYEAIFDILARQFEIAKLDEARQGALIQVVDPAIPPDKQSFPRRVLIIGLSPLCGLFLGILIVVCKDYYQRVKSAPEANQKLAQLRQSIGRTKNG